MLDEGFIRGATATEGSARARMLAARWRENPPEHTGFREAAGNDGGRWTMPTRAARPPRRRWSWRPWRRGRTAPPAQGRDRTDVTVAVCFVLASVVLLAAYNRGAIEDWFRGSDDTVSYVPVDPAQPFKGSQSEGWANGADGIVPPAAADANGFSADEVRAALGLTKDLLVAGNLDRATLNGGFPQSYLDVLAPGSDFAVRLRADLARPHGPHDDPVDWVTRFDPAQTRLIGPVVKVRGSMTYTVDSAGTLRIHASYAFVYAVAPNGGAGRPDRTMVRRELDTAVYKASSPKRAPSGTIRLETINTRAYSAACGPVDGYLHPLFGEYGDHKGSKAKGDSHPYDLDDALPTAPGCMQGAVI
ncbi:hypothetical protein [Yinghuangia seranimata]|uniref:SCO2583/SCO2584 N-terminal domain-containing protein n=1 Tax=Yinghuangia seranimata TaxID=408067 RepID=UPI00248BEAEA|nr:hypothetical protein [Yinghuangia seranimata]MDI2127116.1 hypothetical protein [Yinghuangia seranimata]